MARLLKVLLLILASVVGIVIIASVFVFLFFDPNDFRDKISTSVKEQTGRDLVIDGDLSLTLFPWLAVRIGHTELGNADGFSDEVFLSFEQASLGVNLVPLIFQQELKVGTASLDGLTVNLEIGADGVSNWDDIAAGDDSPELATEQGSGSSADLDIASVRVSNASVTYADARAGSDYSITNLDFETSRIGTNTPIDMLAKFDFESSPGEPGGHIEIRGTVSMSDVAAQISVSGLNLSGTLRGIVAEPTEFNFDSRAMTIDTVAQAVDPGEMDLMVLGLSMSADVEPFSYAGTLQPRAALRVADFSLKDLMRALDIEPPATADPDALERVSFSADAVIGETSIDLSSMNLELDDSMMTGELSVPLTASGALTFDLGVDAIALDGYMAPADDSLSANNGGESGDIEIPVDMIRTLNVNGSFRIDRAFLSGMEFENLELGVNVAGGSLRLHPLAADFYDGSYSGDVRIRASTDVPTISVNESISDVNLASMMKAIFDQDNITGTINGSIALSGSGQSLSAIRSDLDGNMSFELADGAWEGTDVWHQLRSARAMFRQEAVPAPTLPARTEFTTVRATGVVVDGIFRNDDFIAELPFLQLTGGGMVDLTTTEVDYAMQVRVFDRPEFMTGATEEELADFTETVVPLKITGLLSAPSIRPDIESIFRGRVEEAIEEKKEELKDKLLNKLFGGVEEPAADEGAEVPLEEGAEEETEEEPEEDLEEILKKELLKKIFEW